VKGTREARDASIQLHGRLCSAFYAQMVRRNVITVTTIRL
jgi:hypothetical protein